MTENGWPPDTNRVVAISLNDCELVTIPGTNGQLKLWFQKGIPAIILPAIMADLNQYVESANNIRGYTDEGSWTNGNSVKSSNHNGATAFDYNWNDHPMGEALAGWHGSDIINGEEEPEIRRILDFYTWNGIQLVWWANDWDSPKDSMHFQMGYKTYENQLVCWDFINKRIRADGYSTYRRGGKPRGDDIVIPPEHPQANLAQLVADAMGNVTGVDYVALTSYVQDCLRKSNCNNNNRIAMWFAQVGHESVGFKYMKEIWGPTQQQLTYQGRMGNDQPGDGERYMGRGPIQVTGKDNYRELSEWAFDQGYVDSPTYFVDNPTALEQYEYAFLGAVWYWTVARADINDLCDAGDVVTVTQRINGGQTGIEDRRNRWNHCRAMDLMPLLEQQDGFLMALTDQQQQDLYDEIMKKGPSRAGVAEDGKMIETLLGFIYNIDGNVWDARLVLPYLLDVGYAVAQVERVAEDGVAPGSYAAGNPFVAEFAQDVCKALVDFKPKFKALLENAPKKTTRTKKTS